MQPTTYRTINVGHKFSIVFDAVFSSSSSSAILQSDVWEHSGTDSIIIRMLLVDICSCLILYIHCAVIIFIIFFTVRVSEWARAHTHLKSYLFAFQFCVRFTWLSGQHLWIQCSTYGLSLFPIPSARTPYTFPYKESLHWTTVECMLC